MQVIGTKTVKSVAYTVVAKFVKRFGYALTPIQASFLDKIPDLNAKEKSAVRECMPYSMTSPERMVATVLACKYVIDNGIHGDFVEVGVWRGGNAFLAKQIFDLYGAPVTVWLFDTFAGMTEPGPEDLKTSSREPAEVQFKKSQKDEHVDWCYASLDDVKSSASEMFGTLEGIRFIQGDVLETLDQTTNLPKTISILRLDTDWYASTKKELDVLYPRLATNGVLMIDDYGHWDGARSAVEEYFARSSAKPLLAPVDYTGRIALKV